MSQTYQQLASDLLVLAGAAAAILSIILALLAVAQTRAPRGGAVTLALGIVAIAVGAVCSTQPVTPHFVLDAWVRVTSPKSAPGPAPLPDAAMPDAETAPEAVPAD